MEITQAQTNQPNRPLNPEIPSDRTPSRPLSRKMAQFFRTAKHPLTAQQTPIFSGAIPRNANPPVRPCPQPSLISLQNNHLTEKMGGFFRISIIAAQPAGNR